ncbi:type II toxin-antitoxin system HicA family toxin [Mucilaginibacter sp. P25]|uniref:Type II toxin-antitoxin system HicA family toxin n=2 Tax=Mucilaginibacter TaxID=423349 RepID=A0AAE6JJ56_9SPHI|nr:MULTISPECIES: type II toxin-antitoxin system HicA family toxin [Mucilaginibacter]QEM05597.1 type II toxin-antitoxin system HicA family toxin [Mucilaginibacter rubeus]QEM18184.1 type II toxin-antitoxin system HicA family toxin [Mucilaginibacter gossypii]QTE36882.1 type II toxin-antitoxin system HicA family toxin [Mucilaginibacter gossypii]QTE45282.1 type II toxin-antitoxin system HicA family toxin [Mucilaginibacter rubeus]QTE51878.1 type II toxin-antitoxin system HicA family toxin [Mucilagin
MSPRAPRDVSGKDLIKVLLKYGYEVIRQTGSHIRLSITLNDGVKNITIPNHDPIKLGTLMAIINDVAEQLKINKEDIINKL